MGHGGNNVFVKEGGGGGCKGWAVMRQGEIMYISPAGRISTASPLATPTVPGTTT